MASKRRRGLPRAPRLQRGRADRPARLLVRLTLHLILLQAVAGVPVFLFFDHTFGARTISLVYLAVVAYLGYALGRQWQSRPRGSALWGAAAASLVWQAPGLIGTFMAVRLYLGFDTYTSGNDLTDFVMQTWHTVLLPLFTLLPTAHWQGAAPYYWATVLTTPVLLLLFLGSVSVGQRARR